MIVVNAFPIALLIKIVRHGDESVINIPYLRIDTAGGNIVVSVLITASQPLHLI